MTTTEQRELDAWIAEHVMGLTLWRETPERVTAILNPNEFVLSIPRKIVRARIGDAATINFQPTTDPAASREIEKKCLEELSNQGLVMSIRKIHNGFEVAGQGMDCDVYCESGPTLEIALANFARRLFEK
jgi:hypothetical protein